MFRNSSTQARLFKRVALATFLGGAMGISQSASAQQRGLLDNPAETGFNAAGQAVQRADQQAQSAAQNARNLTNPAQRGINAAGQAVERAGERIQSATQGRAQAGVQTYNQGGAQTYNQGGAQPYNQGGAQVYGQGGAQVYGQGGAQANSAYQQQGQRRGQFGIQVQQHDDGLQVVAVRDNSTAKSAGIKEGDIIKRFNDQDVADAQWLNRQVRQLQADDEIELVVLRDGHEETLSATFDQQDMRYQAARPAIGGSMQAELEELRNEIKQLREEMKSLKAASEGRGQSGEESNDNDDQ